MKTVKPFRLGVLTRPYRWKGRDALGVAVMGLVSLEDRPLLMADQELWQMMASEIDPGGVLDMGVPKATPEMLVSGHCYTAHQKDKTAAAVRVRVGGLEKTLTVFGDRYWLNGRVTPAQPFDAMRVDWSHAYGGERVAENPLGIGSADEIVNGLKVRRLPNVEMPGKGAVAPDRPAMMAGFGALMPHWPQRMALVGRNFGDAWLQNDFPGFASDMDWAYFNAAPPDQRWRDAQEVPRGAAYEIWNMHPEVPVLSGHLPDWRARCFASFRADGGELCEASLRMTTVWFVPHLRRAVLIWHGNFDIGEDDAADMKHIMPALELPDAARPLSHYQDVLQRRIDPNTSLHVLRDSDLVPRSVFGPWAAAQVADKLSGPLARNMRAGALRERERRSAELQAQGLDPSLYLPPPAQQQEVPSDIDDLPEFSERKKKEMAQQRETLVAEGKAHQARLLSDPLAAEDIGAHEGASHRFDLHDALRDFRRAERQAKASQAEPDAPPMFSAPIRQGMPDRLREGHLHAAHLSAPAPAAMSFRSGKLRRRLAAAPANARNFARMNLTGIDLSGMDLRGADFTQALLEDANLEGAVLDDCNLTRAVLARARLGGASLARARLAHANMGGATCTATVFADADFHRTNCQKTTFSGCDLSGARFDQIRLYESRFSGCDLRRSQWSQIVFMEMALENIRFDGACFKQVVWIKCALVNVSYAGATLHQSGFTESRGDEGLDFSGAELVACSVVHKSSFIGAVFRGAQIRQCGLRSTALSGADFSGARLEGSDFSECDLRRARLDQVVAGESLFVRADFTAASLRGANLIDANLSKSVLLLADLSDANLFRADVSQALIDPTTRMDGAYTHNAKIWPARRVKPQT